MQIPQHRTILITGATSGIGRAAAASLAELGHTVVIAGRSPEKCAATAQTIERRCGRVVDWLVADLASLAEVRRLAAEFCDRYRRLDALINNAGAVYIHREETADGIELGWAVNYFQAFLLTHLLLDRLKASAPARIINLSSSYHRFARLDLANLAERGPYIGWNVYANTKLASLYFTYELSRRLEGNGVTVNAIHPGLVATGMGKTSGRLLRAVFGIVDRFAVSPEKGAEGLVALAVHPAMQLVNGKYFEAQRIVRSSPVSHNREIARRLWQQSLEITGA